MGADLYIKSTYEPNREKYQPKFERHAAKRDAARTEVEKRRHQKQVEKYYGKMYEVGYFRDSYNNSNLLWKLGLDYWVWFAQFLDEEGLLHPDKIETVVAGIESHKHLLDDIEDKEEQVYFREKCEELILFLRSAIERDEPVACSI